ncbi:MAG: hypothetical protein WCS27_12275 [Victivallaceae bacterium]
MKKNNEPLAFCRNCQADRPMQWKELKLRGKTVDTWFVCAVCGCGDLEIKYLSCAEAIARNRGNCGRASARLRLPKPK